MNQTSPVRDNQEDGNTGASLVHELSECLIQHKEKCDLLIPPTHSRQSTLPPLSRPVLPTPLPQEDRLLLESS